MVDGIWALATWVAAIKCIFVCFVSVLCAQCEWPGFMFLFVWTYCILCKYTCAFIWNCAMKYNNKNIWLWWFLIIAVYYKRSTRQTQNNERLVNGLLCLLFNILILWYYFITFDFLKLFYEQMIESFYLLKDFNKTHFKFEVVKSQNISISTVFYSWCRDAHPQCLCAKHTRTNIKVKSSRGAFAVIQMLQLLQI